MAWFKNVGRLHQVVCPAVVVGNALCDDLPPRTVGPSLERYRYADRRCAGCDVEYVGGDGAHCSSNLVNLISVIFSCSSAAILSSVAAELLMRALQMASISLADRPVAQTMNIKPNFSRYKRFASASICFISSSASS